MEFFSFKLETRNKAVNGAFSEITNSKLCGSFVQRVYHSMTPRKQQEKLLSNIRAVV
jgi:hypothetical protein